ncbi:MAG TPA: GAF domain-containing protein [Chloroflexota bacterium]
MIDIDRYKWTEEHLGDDEQQVSMLHAQAELLDLAHDAIFVRDASSGGIVYWNHGAEALYGYDRDDAVGRVSHDLLQTQFPQPLREIEEIMTRDGKWEGELVQRTRDGREVTIESRWALQRDARGEPDAFLEINRDVTERKQAEAQLNRRVKELAEANTEIARRHRELEAINVSLASISQALDLSDVLQNIVDAARDLIHSRYAALGVADGHGFITEFITSGITADQRAAIGPLPQGHGLLGTLIREAKPLRVSHIAEDPRSQGFPPHHPPMRTLLGVPILYKGRVVGNLYLTDKVDAAEFSEDDQELLVVLAHHAAVAIENAQLYEDARSARDQLRAWNRNLEVTVAERTQEVARINRELTARIFQAQEEERGRIARELHDETAQALARLLIDLDLVTPHIPDEGPISAAMTRLEQGLKRTLDEVRTLSHDLRPAILEDFGLAAALKAYSDDWMQTFGVPVRVEVQAGSDDRLPSEMEIALFRIAQEALMNAGKYARATEVQVSLSFTEVHVELVVRDNGGGFDPEGLPEPTRQRGLGLYGMRERATLLGGHVAIESAPGQGTEVRLLAPLP